MNCKSSTSDEQTACVSVLTQTSFTQWCIVRGDYYPVTVVQRNVVHSSWQTMQLPKFKLEILVVHLRGMQRWGCTGAETEVQSLLLWLSLSALQWGAGDKKYKSGPLCKSEHAVGTLWLWLGAEGSMVDCLHTASSNKDAIFFSFEYTLPFTSFPVSDIVCDSLPYQSTTVRNWRMHEFLLPPMVFWQVKD